MSQKKSAFTLIELLVVIAIIGILATVSIISLSNARAKSRDAKRAGDMKQVQTALELFFNDNNRYPTPTEWATGKIYATSSAGTSTYMQIIPSASTPVDGNCTDNQNTFSYVQTENGNSYSISLCLGNTTGTLTPGPKCLTPGGIIDVDCSTGGGGACDQNFEFCNFSNCGDTGTYQGLDYNTISINGSCVFFSGLNAGNPICSSGTTCATYPDDNFARDNIEKYCYDNDSNNCSTFGALYTWAEAVGLANKCNLESYYCDGSICQAAVDTSCNFPDPTNNLIQGVCPSGWHVPSEDEFELFSASLGGNTAAGAALKEIGTTHWASPNTGATNSSGFTARASGYRTDNGSFVNINSYSMIWTSMPYSNYAYVRRLFYNSTSFDYYQAAARNYSALVRCFKN